MLGVCHFVMFAYRNLFLLQIFQTQHFNIKLTNIDVIVNVNVLGGIYSIDQRDIRV